MDKEKQRKKRETDRKRRKLVGRQGSRKKRWKDKKEIHTSRSEKVERHFAFILIG